MKHTRECIALQMQPFCNITQPPLQTHDELGSYYHKKPSTTKSEQKLCIIYSSVVKELNNPGFNEITTGGSAGPSSVTRERGGNEGFWSLLSWVAYP